MVAKNQSSIAENVPTKGGVETIGALGCGAGFSSGAFNIQVYLIV